MEMSSGGGGDGEGGSSIYAATNSDTGSQINFPPSDALFNLDGSPVTSDQFLYGCVIIMITALLLISSILTIAVILSNENLKDVIGCYLISLAVSDLILALFVTPLAVYAALDSNWKYGMNTSPLLCKIEAYLGVMIWTTVAYTFMWIGVDRYAALQKPARYDVDQTFTRCKCWILFTWISAMLLSCPILAAEMQAEFYPETFLCVLDWSATKAYSATLASLVLLPSLIGTIYSYHYIFGSIRNPDDLEDTQKTMLETDHNYMMTFFVILAFILSWAPWFILQSYEWLSKDPLPVKTLHFSLMWLAIGGGAWKLLIYIIMNRDFRKGLGRLWTRICCGSCCNRSRAGGGVDSAAGGGGTATSNSILISSAHHKQQQQQLQHQRNRANYQVLNAQRQGLATY